MSKYRILRNLQRKLPKVINENWSMSFKATAFTPKLRSPDLYITVNGYLHLYIPRTPKILFPQLNLLLSLPKLVFKNTYFSLSLVIPPIYLF